MQRNPLRLDWPFLSGKYHFFFVCVGEGPNFFDSASICGPPTDVFGVGSFGGADEQHEFHLWDGDESHRPFQLQRHPDDWDMICAAIWEYLIIKRDSCHLFGARGAPTETDLSSSMTIIC